eukprot:UN10492
MPDTKDWFVKPNRPLIPISQMVRSRQAEIRNQGAAAQVDKKKGKNENEVVDVIKFGLVHYLLKNTHSNGIPQNLFVWMVI